jgi:hypothetical protein
MPRITFAGVSSKQLESLGSDSPKGRGQKEIILTGERSGRAAAKPACSSLLFGGMLAFAMLLYGAAAADGLGSWRGGPRVAKALELALELAALPKRTDVTNATCVVESKHVNAVERHGTCSILQIQPPQP